MANNQRTRTFIAVSTWEEGYDDTPEQRSFSLYPDSGDTVTVRKGETEFGLMVIDWLATMGENMHVRSFKNDRTQSLSISSENYNRYVHIAINYVR